MEPPTARRRGRPPTIDRRRIVEAATTVARSDGVAALSMRRVADEVSMSPMALYRHVPDKETLLLAMLDEVARDVRLPAPVEDPLEELTGLLLAAHEAFVREPWVVQLLVVEGLASPLVLPLVERLFAGLSRGGVADEDIPAAYALLWHYLEGEALASHHDRPDTFTRQMVREALDRDPEGLPTVRRVAATLPPRTARDFFRRNLRTLLRGVLAPPSSPPPGREGEADDDHADHDEQRRRAP